MTDQAEARGVAIVGMACRFPGAPDIDAFWANLAGGVDCIRHFTDDELRVAGVPDATLARPDYVKAAPVIDGFDQFDAGFFEYSPREARLMDPQQRLLLQEAWHALEDAGEIPGGDRRIGAYMGSGGVVTSYLLAQAGLHGATTGSLEHLANDKDFVSTRLSYKLGLTGPSINVQTACSTSLVAVHLACQSILDGECDVALAGAATVRVPHMSGYLHRAGDILSPDGKCRAYDADAEGTVFGSGVGVVVLKHVQDALADGDRIYAVILGSAVNNDGGEKLSFTASSTEGQARAMAAAFAAAEISPSEIGLIEGHGTGTVVGDPLEAEALRRCFATDPNTAVGGCWLGSVKTNIGHLEQAAGVASLIKAALALRHRTIPASLNFETPNPRIDLETGPYRVSTEACDWPQSGAPRRAAVNSLGLGGTNAFAILQEAPEATAGEAPAQGPLTLAFSARSEAALARLGEVWTDRLSKATDIETTELCAAALHRRADQKHRRAIVAENADSLRRALADGRGLSGVAGGERRIAFLFPGQGAQYLGMARGLLQGDKTFAASYQATAARLRDHAGVDVERLIYHNDDPTKLSNTGALQPALFAVELALADMLASRGVKPDVVLGHSVGAYAAAVVAGVYARDDACDLIARRAGLMADLPAGGAMAAIFADEDAVRGMLGKASGVDVAVLNSSVNTVVAGASDAVRTAVSAVEREGVAAHVLDVSHAFHSYLMAPMLDAFEAAAAGLAANKPKVTFISDMTGDVLQDAPDKTYLTHHIRQPVRFADGLRRLTELGCTDLVEVGPGSALRSFAAVETPGVAGHGLLRKGEDDVASALNCLAGLWVNGAPVELGRTLPRAAMVTLPAYPFDTTRYWLDDRGGAATTSGQGLLGEEIRSPSTGRQFQTRMSSGLQPWMTDHQVYDAVTLPVAAALIGLSRLGAQALGGPAEVRDLTYHEALLIDDDGERILHADIAPDGAAMVSSLDAGQSDNTGWSLNLSAVIASATAAPAETGPAALKARCRREVEVGAFYRGLDQIGLNYGPLFRSVRALSLGDGEALGRIALPADVEYSGDPIHPALIDACLHLFPAVSGLYGAEDFDVGEDTSTFLPISVERFAIHAEAPATVFSHVSRRRGAEVTDRYIVDVHIYDEAGGVIAEISGLTVKRLDRLAFLPRSANAADWLYEVDWRQNESLMLKDPAPGRWLIVAEDADEVEGLCAALTAAGQEIELMTPDMLLAGPRDDGAAVAGVVLATALSAPPLMTQSAAALETASERQFAVSQAALRLLTSDLRANDGKPRLWILTRGAQAPLETALGGEAMQAVLWGHGRVIGLEHPNIWGGLIDIDHQTDPADVAAELLAPDGEGQIALRAGKRYAPRLVRLKTAADAPAIEMRKASYLITGGLGSLGLKTAAWLAERGAARLWLVSRRTPSAEQQAALDALDADVVILSADVADPAAVADLIERIGAEGPPLDGVFHCAGLLDDGIMSEMDWPKYHRVIRPKIEGAWALHQATESLPLSYFVTYSSILSVIGSMGQLNYVSGNAFLDALTSHRRRLGLAATAMNWGPWEVPGLATESGERGRAIWRARGTEYIPADDGMEAMELALRAGAAHAVVTLTDWSTFVRQFSEAPPFYAELASGGGVARIALDRDQVKAALAAADAAERPRIMAEALGEICAVNLELDTPPPSDLSLREAGLDSLMSITVINDIEAVFDVRVEAREMLRGPTTDELAAVVLAGMNLPVGPDSNAPRPAPMRASRPAGAEGKWLVTQRPRPNASVRLICFPFAGGGSAVFDDWGDAFDPSIEIVAVEPPGRLGRIDETPVRTVEQFARALMPELQEKLDRPYAMLGHCLGGLTLYETLRFLEARNQPPPVHIFVSGARPPSVLRAPGDFERELDTRLRNFGEYRAGKPGYEQDDHVLAEIVRAFGISDSARMLEQEELRELILPTVRAEFEMAGSYVYLPEQPFPSPITCFRGEKDEYFRAIDARMWRKFTSSTFELFTRDTGHFAIVEDFPFIRQKIEERLLAACADAA